MVRGHGLREAWGRPVRSFLLLLRPVGLGLGLASRQPRENVRSLCLRIRHSRNQDHSQRVHHQRLLGQMDLLDQIGVDYAGGRGRPLSRKRRPDGSHGLLYGKHLGEMSNILILIFSFHKNCRSK